MEIWRDTPGYGGHYQASSIGRVRSKDRVIKKYSGLVNKVVNQKYKGRILKSKPGKDGYIIVHLGVNKRKYNVQVGRLVLMAFVGLPKPDQECCHNNGNPSDNSLSNLRWDTHKENNRDRLKHGTYATGSNHHMSKLTESDVKDIFSSSERGCDLALRYGVHQSIISDIRKRRTWKNITNSMDHVPIKTWRSSEKLNKDKAEIIRSMRDKGSSVKELSKTFSVSESNIRSVLSGDIWK